MRRSRARPRPGRQAGPGRDREWLRPEPTIAAPDRGPNIVAPTKVARVAEPAGRQRHRLLVLGSRTEHRPARTGWQRRQGWSRWSVVASTIRHPSQRPGVANRLAMTCTDPGCLDTGLEGHPSIPTTQPKTIRWRRRCRGRAASIPETPQVDRVRGGPQRRHRRIVPPSSREARTWPSGENATARTGLVVADQRAALPAGGRVPQLDGAVRAGGGERGPVGREGHRPDQRRVSHQRAAGRRMGHVGDVPDPHRPVPAPRGQGPAVARERDGRRRWPCVPGARQVPAGGHVPEPHGPSEASRGEGPAVGRERQPAVCIQGSALERRQWLAGVRVPELQGTSDPQSTGRQDRLPRARRPRRRRRW